MIAAGAGGMQREFEAGCAANYPQNAGGPVFRPASDVERVEFSAVCTTIPARSDIVGRTSLLAARLGRVRRPDPQSSGSRNHSNVTTCQAEMLPIGWKFVIAIVYLTIRTKPSPKQAM